MSTAATRADSLRLYLTGAGSDGGVQTSADASLGNYRSSTEAQILTIAVTSAISNVTILFAAGANGLGTGTLTATDANTLAWTPPGGSQGAGVAIANGETKVLEGGGGSGPNQFLRVTRTSASSLTGTANVALTDTYNNAIGESNVSSAQAAAGVNTYHGLIIKNDNSVGVATIKAYVGTLGTQQTSDSGQLGVSGSGTITTTGSFADWPDTGYCRIATSGGTLREIVYYSSRTGTALTVPSAGRALASSTAAAGANTDLLDAVPGIRIGSEALSSSHIQTIANENTAPSGISWVTGITAATGVSIGTLAAAGMIGLWIHRFVPAGAVSSAQSLQIVKFDFDAA